jgi:hypothetical protein
LKHSFVNRGFPAGNPIANVFVILVGALAIAVSLVLGFVAFVVLGSIVVVLAAVVGLRLWWLNRKLSSQARRGATNGETKPGGVIEGEFHVIDDGRESNGDG